MTVQWREWLQPLSNQGIEEAQLGFPPIWVYCYKCLPVYVISMRVPSILLRHSELLESKSSQKDPSQWDTAFQAASVHSHSQHTMGSALSYQNIYVCMQDTGTPPTQREVMRKFGPRATGYVNWQYKGGGVWESGRQKEICYE